MKTTWTAREGKLSFLLPDRSVHEFPATNLDHPMAMCQVLDVVAGLSPVERRAVLSMATGIELRRLNAKKEERR